MSKKGEIKILELHLMALFELVLLLIVCAVKLVFPFALIYFVYYLFVKKGNKK